MRRIGLLIAFAVGTLACGTAAEAPDTPEVPELRDVPEISEAAANTLAEGSARMYTKQVMAFADESQGVLTTISEGAIDFESLRQHATMWMAGDGGQSELIAQQMGKMEIVGEGFVMYMKSDLYQQLPGVKEWVKLDLQAAGEQLGLDMNALMQLGSSDPSGQLNYLTGFEDVQEVGTERVRGARTTHYKGTVSFDALSEELPDDAAATIERLQELMGVSEVDGDVWLDEDGLARRVTFVYEKIPSAGTAVDGTWTMTMEYYDFGTEVAVEIPPEDQVTDMLQLMEEMQGTSP